MSDFIGLELVKGWMYEFMKETKDPYKFLELCETAVAELRAWLEEGNE